MCCKYNWLVCNFVELGILIWIIDVCIVKKLFVDSMVNFMVGYEVFWFVVGYDGFFYVCWRWIYFKKRILVEKNCFKMYSRFEVKLI